MKAQKQLVRGKPDYEGALYHILTQYCDVLGNDYNGVKATAAAALLDDPDNITIFDDGEKGLFLFKEGKKIPQQTTKNIVEGLLTSTILGSVDDPERFAQAFSQHPLPKIMKEMGINSTYFQDANRASIVTSSAI